MWEATPGPLISPLSLTKGVYFLKIEDSEGVSHTFRIIRWRPLLSRCQFPFAKKRVTVVLQEVIYTSIPEMPYLWMS